MKVKLLIAAISLISTVTIHAEAKPNWYSKIYIGASSQSDQTIVKTNPATLGELDLKRGGLIGASIGRHLNEKFAIELSWDYQSANAKATLSDGTRFGSGDYASNLIFITTIYKLKPSAKGKWAPYIGLGVGFAEEIDLDLERNNQETSYSTNGDFATQLILGAAYQINEQWQFTTELKMQQISDLELSEEEGSSKIESIDYQPNNIVIGVAYNF